MVGIIYKFTITALLKREGQKPFYIGQHWEKKSIEHFISNKRYNYDGSGSIWICYLEKIKKMRPHNWRNFIKREVLCVVTNGSQRTLDKLEEFWIKREKAHYSYRLGGCNVLWGTANWNRNNPMYDKRVIEIVRKKKFGRFNGENCYWYGRHLSEETKEKLRQKTLERYRNGKHPCLGKKMSDEARKHMREGAAKRDRSTYAHGFKRTDAEKEKIRQGVMKYYQTHNSPFKGKTHSEESRKKISIVKRKRDMLNKVNK